jgi:hypothetical protein
MIQRIAAVTIKPNATRPAMIQPHGVELDVEVGAGVGVAVVGGTLVGGTVVGGAVVGGAVVGGTVVGGAVVGGAVVGGTVVGGAVVGGVVGGVVVGGAVVGGAVVGGVVERVDVGRVGRVGSDVAVGAGLLGLVRVGEGETIGWDGLGVLPPPHPVPRTANRATTPTTGARRVFIRILSWLSS